MAVDSGRRHKHLAARRHSGVLNGWLLLLANPTVEIGPRLDGDAQEHMGVLRPAVQCALPDINACSLRTG